MCGICGIFRFDGKSVQPATLNSMMSAMRYRGPDDEGIFINENVGLGFVRLSIIDLTAAGHQPMVSSDGRYVIIYNGEVFNYIEIKQILCNKGFVFATQTDTEVVLNAFREWGEECLNKFNGMWAFAIFDRELKRLFIARDRYGIKPFYYYINQDYFVFSSEIPSLLKAVLLKPSANYAAIFDYLVFNRTDHTEKTFFNSIQKLQHGCSLSVQEAQPSHARVKLDKWYDLNFYVNRSSGFKDSREFYELFADSVGLRLRSDVPVGVCLSGGLDSSSIVSVLLQKFNKYDLNTFSAVYRLNQVADESKFINIYKTDIKNMFYTIPDSNTLCDDIHDFIIAHGEPIPSASPYAQFRVMKLAKENVVVTLDGQGADEMLAGYHYFYGFFFKDLLRNGHLIRLPYEIIAYLFMHCSFYGLKTFAYFLMPSEFRTKSRIEEKGYLTEEFAKHFSGHSDIANTLYASRSLHDALLAHFEFKLEHLLKWEDRNSMWHSLEARVPFLDHRLVERTLSLRNELLIKDGMTKTILREAMKGILPEKIRMRRDKNGFDTPQDDWFREPRLQNLVNAIINSASFADRRIIDSQKAKYLYNLHCDRRINIGHEIWKWIHLEMWFQKFID